VQTGGVVGSSVAVG